MEQCIDWEEKGGRWHNGDLRRKKIQKFGAKERNLRPAQANNRIQATYAQDLASKNMGEDTCSSITVYHCHVGFGPGPLSS